MSIWTTVPAHIVSPPSIPVISVGNLKGGVGKTTLVANVAMALVQSGLRVLAIDLDFQASLSVALPSKIMLRNEQTDGGMNILLGDSYDMFHDGRITSRGIGKFTDLSLVRTSLGLADVEDRLLAAYLLGKLKDDPRFALARKLADPQLKNDFDLVIVDTPPRLTIASINALCASTHVLIPTALTPMAQSGAVTFVEILKKFNKTLCPSLDVLGIIPTFTKGTLNDVEKTALNMLQKHVPQVEIWDDAFIPLRQDIASNKFQYNSDIKSIFEAVKKKITNKLGLKPDENDGDPRSYRGFGFSRPGLSQ